MDTVQTIINLTKKCIENRDWFQYTRKDEQPHIKQQNYEDLIKLQKKENITPRICQILFLSQIFRLKSIHLLKKNPFFFLIFFSYQLTHV